MTRPGFDPPVPGRTLSLPSQKPQHAFCFTSQTSCLSVYSLPPHYHHNLISPEMWSILPIETPPPPGLQTPCCKKHNSMIAFAVCDAEQELALLRENVPVSFLEHIARWNNKCTEACVFISKVRERASSKSSYLRTNSLVTKPRSWFLQCFIGLVWRRGKCARLQEETSVSCLWFAERKYVGNLSCLTSYAFLQRIKSQI